MSDFEQSKSEQELTPEDNEDSGQHEEPVSSGVDPSLTTNDLGHGRELDIEPDEEQTRSDLDESGVDLFNPSERASEMVITIEDHLLSTDPEPEPDDAISSVQEMSGPDLQRLRRVLDEEASRRSTRVVRPFKELDTESLQLLFVQVRAELGMR